MRKAKSSKHNRDSSQNSQIKGKSKEGLNLNLQEEVDGTPAIQTQVIIENYDILSSNMFHPRIGNKSRNRVNSKNTYMPQKISVRCTKEGLRVNNT